MDQIAVTNNIRVLTDTTVAELRGADHLEEVALTDSGSGESTVEPGTGLFIFVGAVPHADFLDGVVIRNPRNFIQTGPDMAAPGSRRA